VAPAGITLRELVDEYCGGMPEGHELYGYFPGGASGGILPASLADIPLDFDTLQPYGCFIGSAAIIVLSQHDSAREAALNAMRFFAHESCGQCTPCREGCGWLASVLHRIENGQGRSGDVELILEVCDNMLGRTICPLADAAVMPAQSFIWKFREEFDGHLREKKCPYGNRF